MKVSSPWHATNLILTAIILLLFACKKPKVPPPPPLSSDKVITSFVFRQSDNSAYILSDITGSVGTDTIYISFPAGTNNTDLKPTIVIYGKSVSPLSGVNRNFSQPVTYTVTAEDGSTKTYTVKPVFQRTVFMNSADGFMYALNGINGQLIWKSVVNTFHSSTPVVSNDMLYAAGRDGIYALDLRSGIQKWRFPLPLVSNFEILPSPMVVNGTLYMGAWDGFVYALNATSGNQVWKTASTTGKAFHSNPTLTAGTVYIGCEDSSIYSINALTGAVNWKFFTGGSVYKNPLVVNNSVFCGGLTNSFYGINATTGAQLWSYPYYFSGTSPSFYNGKVYCGGGSEAWALNAATGALEWHITYNGGISIYVDRSGAAIANDVLIGGSINNKVYAYSLTTNSKIWEFTTNGVIYSSPVVVNNNVYIGSIDGNFYCLDASNGQQIWRWSTTAEIRGSACVSDESGNLHYPVVSGYKN